MKGNKKERCLVLKLVKYKVCISLYWLYDTASFGMGCGWHNQKYNVAMQTPNLVLCRRLVCISGQKLQGNLWPCSWVQDKCWHPPSIKSPWSFSGSPLSAAAGYNHTAVHCTSLTVTQAHCFNCSYLFSCCCLQWEDSSGFPSNFVLNRCLLPHRITEWSGMEGTLKIM